MPEEKEPTLAQQLVERSKIRRNEIAGVHFTNSCNWSNIELYESALEEYSNGIKRLDGSLSNPQHPGAEPALSQLLGGVDRMLELNQFLVAAQSLVAGLLFYTKNPEKQNELNTQYSKVVKETDKYADSLAAERKIAFSTVLAAIYSNKASYLHLRNCVVANNPASEIVRGTLDLL